MLIFHWAFIAPAGAASAERTFRTANFAVTWMHDPDDPDAPDLTDADGSGVPDVIERLAKALEEVRTLLVVELGYRPPPGEPQLPVYLAEVGSPYNQPAPGGTGRSRASFIVFPRGWIGPATPYGFLKGLAAHEYFHAIQNGYDSSEHRWIAEATATWVQQFADEGTGSANHVLKDFLAAPRHSLHAPFGDWRYGSFLFIQFLTERYEGGRTSGAPLVKELWELMAAPEGFPGAPDLDSVGAVEEVLTRRGSSLREAWGEFLLWKRQLARFEEGARYRAFAGAGVPGLLRSDEVSSESCILTTDTPTGGKLPGLSGDYVRLRPAKALQGDPQAVVTVKGPAGAAGFLLRRPVTGPAQVTLLEFDQAGVARAPVSFGSKRTKSVVLGLGNAARSGPVATLAYSLRLPGAAEVAATAPSTSGTLSYGLSTTISGRVTCRGAPAARAEVMVTATEEASGVATTHRTETDVEGTWSLLVTPQVNSNYRVQVTDPLLSSAASGSARLGVAPFVTISVSAKLLDLGEEVTVSGEVNPAHPDAPMRIEYRRPSSRRWRTAGESAIGSGGRYSFRFVLPDDGVWEVRAKMLATGDSDHIPGTSLNELVTVRQPG
jgi:hypothetical protein